MVLNLHNANYIVLRSLSSKLQNANQHNFLVLLSLNVYCSVHCDHLIYKKESVTLFEQENNTSKNDTAYTKVGTLIAATIYLQLIQNRYVSKFYCPSV